MPGPLARRFAPFALLTGLSLVAAGCGRGSALPPASTVAVTSTTYVTIPARSTTTTSPPPPEELTGSGDEADSGDSGGSEPEVNPSDDPNQERTHEIESGDYLVGIARDYDVPINYIPAYNGWDDGLAHALVPGQTLRIPPADWTPDGEGSADTPSSDSADGGSESSSAGECDTYTIKAGDTKGRVAAAHDISVAELDAANTGTAHYAGFVIGIEIQIPC